MPHFQVDDLSKDYLAVHFGPVRAFIGDAYRFQVDKKRSSEEIINIYKNVTGEPKPNPRKKKIGQHEVILSESYGMGTSRVHEILGENRNFIFEHYQINERNMNQNYRSIDLEKVIETLTLL